MILDFNQQEKCIPKPGTPRRRLPWCQALQVLSVLATLGHDNRVLGGALLLFGLAFWGPELRAWLQKRREQKPKNRRVRKARRAAQ